jgi:formylglycine-generating enzyme required for sulfatase activity
MPSYLQTEPAFKLDLGNGIEMSFQLIEGGSFRMGSRGKYHDEEPRHWVQIAKPFYLGTFPVTQQQFAKWKPEHENEFANNPHHPAENMDWHEANQYCSWLTTTCRDQLPAGYAAGLPTEAQWEYACRAGTDTEYYTGDGEAALAAAGWYAGNSESKTQTVGQLQGNDFGLYDMHGNVWEWCVDAYDRHAYRKRVNNTCDPFVDSASDADRVVRGGSWGISPGGCRSAYRGWRRPVDRFRVRGFRVCLFLGPCPGQAERAEQASAGMATRDEAATPERDRAESDFFDDLSKVPFPDRSP